MKLVVPFVSVQWPNFQEVVEAAKQRICTFYMKWWEIIQKSRFLVKTILSIIRILYVLEYELPDAFQTCAHCTNTHIAIQVYNLC